MRQYVYIVERGNELDVYADAADAARAVEILNAKTEEWDPPYGPYWVREEAVFASTSDRLSDGTAAAPEAMETYRWLEYLEEAGP